MKKLVIIFLLLFNVYTNAQSKGSFVLGGTVNFIGTDTDDRDYGAYSFITEVQFGYVQTPSNFEFGLSLGYIKKEGYEDYDNGTDGTGFVIAPYVRQYYPINEKFSFFAEGELRSTKLKEENRFSFDFSRTYGYETRTFLIGFRPGFVYFFSKHIALDASIGFIGYQNEVVKDSDNDEVSKTESGIFSLNASAIQVGFSYFF